MDGRFLWWPRPLAFHCLRPNTQCAHREAGAARDHPTEGLIWRHIGSASIEGHRRRPDRRPRSAIWAVIGVAMTDDIKQVIRGRRHIEGEEW